MTFRQALSRTAGFGLVYLLATYLGRLTVMDGTSLSLVWPAAGVLALWFVAQRTSRWKWLDVAVLAVITMVVNTQTGAPARLAAVFVVANLVQALVFAHLLERWVPGLWSTGGRPLARLSELWGLVGAATVSTTASALIGPTGIWLDSGHYSWTSAAVWLARNTVSILLIGVAARRFDGLLGRDRITKIKVKFRFEYAAVVLCSACAYYFAFLVVDGLPVAFALIGLTAWAALRLHTSFVILHDLAFGTLAVLFTLHGSGPFAQIDSLPMRALVAQLFVGTIAIVGLALALGRDERVALLDRLMASERAATEQAQLLTTIIDSMSEGLGVIDEKGGFLLRNPAATSLLGGRPNPSGQVRDPGYYGLFHADGTPVGEADMPHHLAFGGTGVQNADYLVRNAELPEGRIINLSATRLPVNMDGATHAVVVFRDVTADRRRRDELVSFAGVVAHDLLNPLATIEGWAEALHQSLNERDDHESVDSVIRIQRAAARMSSLINGLLAFTTARDATLSASTVDLREVVGEIAAGRVDQAQSTGTPVPRFVIGDLGAVDADPVLVRQLLDNLIGNAVKYTAPGVTPYVSVVSEPAADGFVRIDVVDNGIGIPPGQHEAIFHNFHRAHRTAGYAGTGLGLTICKRIVERHGGTIAATDNPSGRGSRMTFTLPAGNHVGPEARQRSQV
ncbi:ATP-binding protein [Actinoplanes friuliensis]|uniref:Sensor-like histidine kinase SenX3 n=1 Tax=Actinoplanes friuliensis DSM 7358 TaxID=1246995 RepID=U5VWS2_9ACTN|nr:ATP-binding protein [Actinoplanes friuliensis]AGZ40081.1 Sensor protein kinase walK [Actinoplanes friuliensis DSM 7358]